MESRRLQRERAKKEIRRRVEIVIVIFIIYIIAMCIYWLYRENSIRLADNFEDNTLAVEKIVKKEEEPISDKQQIATEYMGYSVAAEIEIPKINLNTYIIENYSIEAMDLCPTKYWGVDANEIGNFCVTGHNYKKENMFSELTNLSEGDEFYLLDNKNGKYTYTVYDIYRVKSNNTDCLNQNTNGEREVTLITCSNFSNFRLIVKARET